MLPSSELKQRLIRELRAWIAHEHLTQYEAAQRLQIQQSSVCELERFSAVTLLNLWARSGGVYEITLGRPDSDA
jgi:predicted XRE-type DNA-binding protein